jgi:hypothetical protein
VRAIKSWCVRSRVGACFKRNSKSRPMASSEPLASPHHTLRIDTTIDRVQR